MLLINPIKITDFSSEIKEKLNFLLSCIFYGAHVDFDKPSPSKEGAVAGQAGAEGELAHDFEAQKRIHQQIRNDPDYDDWEYGTEPLPHEAWATVRPQEHAPDESAAQA